jgi:hypothetical protein
MKRTITVTLANAEKYDAGFPTDDAIGFASWLAGLIEQVPAEFRHTAKLKIDAVGCYEDSHYATVTFLYSRKETDEEEAARESKEGGGCRDPAQPGIAATRCSKSEIRKRGLTGRR